MEKLLFINGCMRGEDKSRTHLLCREFLSTYRSTHPDSVIEQLDLAQMPLTWLDEAALDGREALITQGRLDAPLFGLARQFAAADRILIGAPYWDLSIPAVVKVYIEQISVRNITFAYTDRGQEGRCRAQKLLFITTAGGPLEKDNCASRYLEALCHMYGIDSFEAISAEGIDIWDAPVSKLMDEAAGRARTLAETW